MVNSWEITVKKSENMCDTILAQTEKKIKHFFDKKIDDFP